MKSEQKQLIAKKQTSTTTFEAIKPSGQGTSLTSKQEKFAQLVASGKSLSDAYRGGFGAENCTDKSIHELASTLMASIKVASRVDELRSQYMVKTAEEVFYGYQESMVELEDAIAFAKQCQSPGALVAAINSRQKISGLHVEDRKNELNPVAGMDSGRVKAALEALQVMRKAKEKAIP